MEAPKGAPESLTIITSNVERQLPEPFLRRCVFFHIRFPEDHLPTILKDHFKKTSGTLRDQALKIFLELRRHPGLAKKPAISELLTWVQALTTVFDPSLVDERLAEVAKQVEKGKPKHVDWSLLPGFSSLLKCAKISTRLDSVMVREGERRPHSRDVS